MSQISIVGERIKAQFHQLTSPQSLLHSDPESNAQVESSAQAFELWATSTGLNRRSHDSKSLIFQLRDAPFLVEYVCNILGDLSDTLGAIEREVSDGEAHDSPTENLTLPAPSTELIDDELEDLDSFNDVDTVAVYLQETERCLRRLFRLAYRLRDACLKHGLTAARALEHVNSQTGVDLTRVSYHYDKKFITEFINARRRHRSYDVYEHDFLAERLAQASLLRRKQFDYWAKNQPTVPIPKSGVPVAYAPVDDDSIQLGKGRFAPDDDGDILETVSLSSVTLLQRIASGTRLQFPRPHSLEASESEFRCPYCYTFYPLQVLQTSSWWYVGVMFEQDLCC